MLPRQMSSWQLESVQEGPRNLPLKFGQIVPVTAEMILSLLGGCYGQMSHGQMLPGQMSL